MSRGVGLCEKLTVTSFDSCLSVRLVSLSSVLLG
jgi:hypothetical protein